MKGGVGDLAQEVRCLLCKLKDQSSDPQHPHGKLGGAWLKVCNPSSKEMERGSPQTKLASQTSRREEVQVEEEMLPQYIKCRTTKEDT